MRLITVPRLLGTMNPFRPIGKSVGAITLASIVAVFGCAQPQQDSLDHTTNKDLGVKQVRTDAHLWLEEVEGKEALDWVRGQNERSLEALQTDPRFPELEAAAIEIVNATDRIPYGSIRDGYVYNFWQDETNVRGLWRRTPLAEYSNEQPDWETIINFDALSESEDANWVFKGANCYKSPQAEETLCLVSLSNGGKDAVVQREFNLRTKSWVTDGFQTPEAKQEVTWLDHDTLLVSTDWDGDGATLTESGYGSIVKRWHRGTPLENAHTVFSGERTDVASYGFRLELDDGRHLGGIVHADSFFTAEYFLLGKNDQVVPLSIPPKSTPNEVYKGQLLIALKQDWAPEGQSTTFKSGDLVSFDMDAYLEDNKLPNVELVFRPSNRQSFVSVSRAGNTAILSINDNVVGKLLQLDRIDEGWVLKSVSLPGEGQAKLAFANKRSDTVFINFEGFLTPDSLLSLNVSTGNVATVKSIPARFNATGLKVQQRQAISADGTEVPYFVVHRDDLELDGSTPTLLYAYGGFQVSLTPAYSAITGKLWLEQGGAYVLANIRGGGEFGPEWHQAGLKGNRQRIYDDFIAVAEDLITSPSHLGIMGGSNGGLLMGVMLNQRPDLWKAVVVQVPLLDMLRYHLLLAGASWMGEYGDPDIAEERAFLETISPYHNFDPDTDYPMPFFLTSTKDDRVHPGHARKMAKLFEDAGKPFLYFENIDGGHSAAANLQARATRSALEYTYLFRQLQDASARRE